MAISHPLRTLFTVIFLFAETTATGFGAESVSGRLVQPDDFHYLGAFRLPGDENRPKTFAWGGNAMTFRPGGDPQGPTDGYPGSLYIMGHDRMPYGELPDGNQIAEVSIPVPVNSSHLSDLRYADLLQDFHDAASGLFPTLEEIPRVGMEFMVHPATGPKIHICWGAHFQEAPADVASHGWLDPFMPPGWQRSWYLGSQNLYSVNGYLFEIPFFWADQHTSGRYLGSGRFRDGGWSGMGPSLFAYWPFENATGTLAADGARLQEIALLLYESSYGSDDVTIRALNGYQHPDEWEGGAWLTTPSGKEAVLFAGTKGTGSKYWYGYLHPGGPGYPCVDTEFVGQFTVCRNADGSPCPAGDLTGCSGAASYRGWWSSSFSARFLLYDPADLALVAQGASAPWEPQPYAHFDIDERLFLNPSGMETETLGSGVQRRFRVGAAAYDRVNGLLYLLELFADGAKPVVHAWRLGPGKDPTTD